MSSPAILQGGYVLPLSRSFTQLLLDIVAQKPPHRHPITGLTINFRDPEYSPETGGWHPVEIRLIPAGEDWQLDYVTDFHYAGHPWPELEKRCRCELDATIHVAFPLWRYLSCRRP